MLNQADAELVRNDPSIPGLRLLLDPIAFARKVKELWPQLQMEKIEPTLVSYKAGESCVTAFRLTTSNSTIRLYAKAHSEDASIKLLEAKTRNYAAGDEGMTARILSDFGIIIYAFPNDQKLEKLSHICDLDSQYDLLRALFPTNPTWWNGTVVPMHYSPEQTLVATLYIEEQPQAIIKLLTNEHYKELKERNQNITSNTQLKLPELTSYSDEYYALGYNYLPGVHLNKILDKDETYASKGSELAGQALAQFHSQSIADLYELEIKDRADEIEEIKAHSKTLASLSPFLKAPASQLAEILIEQLERYPEARSLTHGHFIDRHILLSNQHTGILDLDKMYIGDSYRDVGFFIAHLERNVLRGKISAKQAKRFTDSFLDAYGDVPMERVELYTALGLFKMAQNPFQYREPEWLHQINGMLKRARRIMIEINEEDLAAAALAF